MLQIVRVWFGTSIPKLLHEHEIDIRIWCDMFLEMSDMMLKSCEAREQLYVHARSRKIALRGTQCLLNVTNTMSQNIHFKLVYAYNHKYIYLYITHGILC